MGTPWRLLRDGASSGAWNMGVDEALFASARRGRCSLRLYRWDGPWLSLGYNQRFEAERLEVCRSAGVGVVRRVTGGRAVLHGGDLTYSVAAPSHLLRGGLRASYRLVARALVQALRELGVPAGSVPATPQGSGSSGFDCFAAPAQDEICVAGRKLAGSAQRRVEGAFLQHGSIRIQPDPASATEPCGLRESRATSLREVGSGADWPELEEAFLGAFRSVLGVRLEVGELGSHELNQARARCVQSAANPLFAPPLAATRAPQESSRVQVVDR